MVLPILNSNYTEGSGVLVGNLFITAGHVICDAQDPHVKLNGVIYNLDSSREVLFRNDKDENGYDLAVYRIPEVCSDLKLMPEFPRSGTRIGSISYRMSSQGYDKVECTATVGEIVCGNYFTANTSIKLKKGTSGSPVFFNGKVVGIMNGGNNDGYDHPVNPDLPLNFCFFLSSKAILELINNIIK